MSACCDEMTEIILGEYKLVCNHRNGVVSETTSEISDSEKRGLGGE
jgi:hypothetical protein